MKARQALTETNNDFDAALKWLEKDLLASGAAKAEKIKDRTASEGLVSVSVLDGGFGSRIGSGVGPVKAAIIELNCESDFVSRTDEFSRLAADIAHTVAQMAGQQGSTSHFTNLDVASLMETPLKSGTIYSSIMDLIARIGENVTLRRAALLAPTSGESKLRVGSYVHNSTPAFPTSGRVGVLSLLSLRSPRLSDLLKDNAFLTDIEKLERALSRQTAGFYTRAIKEKAHEEDDPETVLYQQPFAMLGGEKAGLPVRQVLDEWEKQWELEKLEVADFVRWDVGESQSK
jgi:elongation factor Ts